MSTAPTLETILSRRLNFLEEMTPACPNAHTRVYFRKLARENRNVQVAVLPGSEARRGLDTVLEARGYDGIAVRNPSDSDIAERPDFHLVPEWVRWLMPCPDSPESWLESLPGSSVRNQMRRKLRASEGVRIDTGPLTLLDYQAWHKHLYVPEVLSKSGAIPAWPEVAGLGTKLKLPLATVADSSVVPGMIRTLMFDRHERLIGGILMSQDVADRTLRIRAGAYEANSRASLELAVRGMCELIRTGRSLGCAQLSYGDDPNLYGVDVTAGLARFKVSVGMQPFPSPVGQLQLLKLFDRTTRRLADDCGESVPSGVLCFGVEQRGATQIKAALQIGAAPTAPSARLPKHIPLHRFDLDAAGLRLAG